MSLSTEDRIKAFLNRQKDKTTIPDIRSGTSAKIDLNLSRGCNISGSFLKDRGDETFNTLNSELPTISLELDHKNSSNPPLKGGGGGDISDLNFDDLEIRMEFIKNFNNSQRVPQPQPRTYQPADSIKSNTESPVRLHTNQSEETSITNKSGEIVSRKDHSQHMQEGASDNSRSKAKSPLDMFFQHQTNIKQKIKKHFRSRSKESRSFSSIKSRNKTPPSLNPEEQKEGQIRSPRWNTNGVKSLKTIVDVEYNYNSISPRALTNPRGSPANSKERKKGKLKKAVSVEKNVQHQTSDSISPESWKLKEISQFSSNQAKASSEILSLEKLLQTERAKNRSGFFGNGDALSTEKHNLNDSMSKSLKTSSKTPDRLSFDEHHASSHSSTTKLMRKQMTPLKKRHDSVDDDDDYFGVKDTKIFDATTQAIQKLEKEYDSFKKPEQARGRTAGVVGTNEQQQDLEEKHAVFKREMKELIVTINKEKEQIFKNLGEMSRKLEKYKTSYNTIKNELEGYKAREVERLLKSPVNDKIPKGNLKKKAKDTESEFGFDEPFTVDQLNVGPLGKQPSQRGNPREQLLSDHVEDINNRVREFVDRSPIRKESNRTSYSDWNALESLKEFEFDKFPAGLSIARELELDPRIFNRSTSKLNSNDSKGKKSSNKDEIIETQREMMTYLYKKLILEEKQRLATEEQAQIMIATMEKSLAQLDGRKKGQAHRKQDSTTTAGSEQLSRSTINERRY